MREASVALGRKFLLVAAALAALDVKLRRSGRVADLATAHIDQVLEIR